jgi:hypothetical protein
VGSDEEIVPLDEVRALLASLLSVEFAVSHELWALLWRLPFQCLWQCLAAEIVDSSQLYLRRMPYRTHKTKNPFRYCLTDMNENDVHQI